MPEVNTFVVDVIVTNYRLNNVQVKNPKDLTVAASINFKKIHITSSRINVSDFNRGSSLEIMTTYDHLRKNIESYGIPIQVMLYGRVVGAGTLRFPSEVTECICPDMKDILHSGEANLDMNGNSVGNIQLLFRMYVKCKENRENVGRHTNLDTSINPQDIMFVMGNACPTCDDICPNTLLPDDDDGRQQLDLLRYQRINMQPMTNSDVLMHNSAINAATYELKKMSRECEEIVNAVTGGVGDLNRARPAAEDAQRTPNTLYDLGYSYMPVYPPSNIDKFESKMPLPMSELAKPLIKPIRFCPVCLTSMSWLPKFAACPMCGIKPMPVLEQPYKNKKFTAEQILLDCLGKPEEAAECVDPCTAPKDTEEQAIKDDPSHCRCNCRMDKECVHCRIRRLCADVFKTDNYPDYDKEVEQTVNEYVVLDKAQQQGRPHLARVFSELCDLYNIKEPKPEPVPCTPKGENRTSVKMNSDRTPVTKDTKRNGMENLTDLMRTKPRTASENIRAVRKRVGHKECLKRETKVPRRHGWAWQSSHLTVKYGWTPGAIWKPIRKLMKFFLQPPQNSQDICNTITDLEKKKNPSPMLNVCKKDGKIFITLRPADNTNSVEQPIEFQITKSDKAISLSEIKAQLKAKGFRKCTCHKPLMMCVCRNQEQKCRLANALHRECRRRGIESLVEDLVLTDTSDSEMEYSLDVAAPIASAYTRQPRQNFATQTCMADRKVEPKWPIDTNPMMRSFNCATGNRFLNARYFGAPGENMIADGRPFGAYSFLGGRSKVSNIWGVGPGGPGGYYRPGGLAGPAGFYAPGGPGGPGGFYGPGGPGAPGGFYGPDGPGRIGGLFGPGSPGWPGGSYFPNNPEDPNKCNKNLTVRMPKRLRPKKMPEDPPVNRNVNMMKYLKKMGKVPHRPFDFKIPPPFFEGIPHRGACGVGTKTAGCEGYVNCGNPCYSYPNYPCGYYG